MKLARRGLSVSAHTQPVTTRFRGYERHLFYYWLPIQTRWYVVS